MTRWILAVLAALPLAAPAAAQDWQALIGAQITQALTDRTLHFANGAMQHFHASGRTLYTHGESSWGVWRVEGAQYCSQWPPSDHWECYDLEHDGGTGFNFIDARGTPFFGRYAP